MKKVTKRKCKHCNEVFEIKRPLECVCSYRCAISYQKTLKANKEALEWKREKAKIKESIKTLSQYEAEAKKSFQHWIRLRDKNLPCISCRNPKPADWCGSHYFSAGMYSGLMFDPRNCHGSCNTYCNKYLSGNLLEYRKGLIKRYGIEFVEQLESESNEKRNYKYTKNELIAIKLKYDILIKEIK
jgi:hypothetical protein